MLRCNERSKLNLTYSNILTIKDSFGISLDSITTDYLPFIDYKNDSIVTFNNDLNLLTILNTKTKQISHYNILITSQKVAYTFWNELNNDVFILTENLNLFKFNIIENKIDTVYQYSKIDRNKLTPIFNTGTKPIFIHSDSTLIISGTLFGKFSNLESTNTLTMLRKQKFEYYLPYPLDYLKKDLGGFYFNFIYHTKFNNSVLVSFPGCDYIGLFDLKEFTVSLSKLNPSIMESSLLSYKENWFSKKIKSSKERRNKYYLENYSYKDIISNPYKNHFYRILYSPLKNDKRECSILVYDERFNFLGVTMLPSNIISSNYFVSKDGVHLQYLKNNKRDEDTLYFYQFIDNF